MNIKTPIKGKMRINIVITITIFLLLSNFFIIHITPKENTKGINEERNINNSEIKGYIGM